MCGYATKGIAKKVEEKPRVCLMTKGIGILWRGHTVTNFIQPYLHQFFDDSHGLKASLKPLKRPFDRY